MPEHSSFTPRNASHWPLTLMGGAVSIINMLLPLVLVRILSQADMGRYKMYFLYMALLPWLFLTAGIGNGLSHWAGHDRERLRNTQASWGLLLGLATLFIIASQMAMKGIQGALGWDFAHTQLLIWGGFVTMLSGFFDEVCVAWGRVMLGAVVSSGFDLARSIAMVVAAWMTHDITWVFAAHIGVFAAKLVLGVAMGWHEGFQRPTFSAKALKPVAAYAMPVSLAAALSIGSGYSDQLLLSRWLGEEDFALYSFGCLMVPPLMIFEQSVNRVLIPKMARSFVGGRTDHARLLYRDAIAELAFLHIPAAAGLMLFSDPIVRLLYTDQYASSAAYLRIYAIHYLINHLPYDVVDRARGRATSILARLAVFAIVAPIMVYAALKVAGPLGALAAAVACNGLMRFSALWGVHAREGWSFRRMLPWRDWSWFFFAAALAAFAGLGAAMVSGTGKAWLLVGGCAFAAVYLSITIPRYRKAKQVMVGLEAALADGEKNTSC